MHRLSLSMLCSAMTAWRWGGRQSDYPIVLVYAQRRPHIHLHDHLAPGLLRLHPLGCLRVHVVAVARELGLLPFPLRASVPPCLRAFLPLRRQPMNLLGREDGAFGEDFLLFGA